LTTEKVLLDGTRQRLLVYHVVMAARKPKGIADDIVGGIRNIVSPWLGAPPAQNNKVTQAQGLARTAAQTLDQTFAGGMIGAGVKGNKALAKQAAVNVAALGTGYVAGKAMQKVAQSLPEVGVHFSKTPNLKKIVYDPKYVNTGGGGSMPSQTYKFSGRDVLGNKIPASKLAESTEHMKWILKDDTTASAYITRSSRGVRDPEVISYVDRDLYVESSRMTPKQKVVKEVKIRGVDPLKNDTSFMSRQLQYEADQKKLAQAIKRARLNPFVR
jgi:hypothetical protein